MRGALSEDFAGSIVLDEMGGASVLAVDPAIATAKPVNLFKRLFAFNHDAYKPMPKNLSAIGRLTRLVKLAWQFVFIETIHAGIDYYKQIGRVSPKFTEFGIAVDFKIEPQVFIGKFNPTQKVRLLSRNYALFFEISYSKTQHRVMVRTRFRREKGAGGLGLPGAKAEVKVFQSDETHMPYRGKSWYPISPPVLSLVLDSSDHYFAQGFTVGVNSGDLIPGSTLTNTFTDFAQGENLIKFEEVPQAVVETFVRTANGILPRSLAPVKMCWQVFALP